MRTACTIIMLFFAVSASAAGIKVDYQVDGESFEGYFVSAGANAPLVLLVHDWDGLTDYEVKRAGMLADMGYAVFAVDLFGKGVRPTGIEAKRQQTGALYGDRERMRKLLNGGLTAAKVAGANIDNAVAAGYCFGGAAVLEMARSGADLQGFVSFHGSLKTPKDQDFAKAKGSILVMHGAADEVVSMLDFSTLAFDLESAEVPFEMITYSGAPHAFTVFGSERYRKDADKKSWRRFVEYLKETLHQEPAPK
ncbi:MAG: dienelactone hydrolase [Desulfuromonas sp.]|nr:MAG: dienelactone hydrolase [Desulfuromonas sp.]